MLTRGSSWGLIDTRSHAIVGNKRAELYDMFSIIKFAKYSTSTVHAPKAVFQKIRYIAYPYPVPKRISVSVSIKGLKISEKIF